MPGTGDRRTRHRSAPRRSLRFSFVLPFIAPAVCICGLWGYTAAGLIDSQIQLHTEAGRVSSVAEPAQDVLSRLQTERRLTAVWQESRTAAARKQLDSARAKTDAAVREYRQNSPSGLDTSALRRSATSLGDNLDSLPARRTAIDGRTLSATDTFAYFTDTISSGSGLLTAAVSSDDGRLARGGTAAISVDRITEMISRQDALLAGSPPSSRLTAAAHAQFVEYLATQQEFRATLNTGDLPGGAAGAYGRITGSAQFAKVSQVEESVNSGRDTSVSQLASAWQPAADSVVSGLQGLGTDSLGDLAKTASDSGQQVLLGIVLGSAAALAALAALAAGVVRALRARRATMRRVSELQSHTDELSDAWLPQVLARIANGERIDPATLAPRGQQATDEVERLTAAIDRLSRVAAETAIQQSLGREGTEKVFAQLIRRTQTLIHRLISLLDDLERKHEDSDLLKDIFKVDHLATRVRRHAENLVILSGAPFSRPMTAPVSIVDVMRGAVAETERYTRVKVKNLPADRRLALTGRAVADVTHLLAELIENGTSFSPPDTQVFVSATRVVKGLVIHVEDHGLGMSQDMLDHANDLLAHPPKLNMAVLSEDPRLGHFVVARLADRHKIKVELRDSVYGGTLVVVLLPSALLEEIDSPVLDHLKSAAAATARSLTATEPAPQQIENTAGSVVGGLVTSASGEVFSPAHSSLPDHSGFPEYGGAGLLPAASDHPTAPAPGPAEWTPSPAPSQGYDAHREAARSGSAPDGSSARTDYPAAGTGRPAPQTWQHHAPPAPAPRHRAPNETPVSANSSAQAAHHPLTTPQVLPQRTRGASLAQQLRKDAAYTQGRLDGDGDHSGISPDASARAMIAIQQGLKQAQMSQTDEPGGMNEQRIREAQVPRNREGVLGRD